MKNKTEGLPEVIEIKKNIPIPPRNKRIATHPITVAMTKMKVGDCFDLPAEDYNRNRNTLYQKARFAKIAYCVRLVRNGKSPLLRVWRTK